MRITRRDIGRLIAEEVAESRLRRVIREHVAVLLEKSGGIRMADDDGKGGKRPGGIRMDDDGSGEKKKSGGIRTAPGGVRDEDDGKGKGKGGGGMRSASGGVRGEDDDGKGGSSGGADDKSKGAYWIDREESGGALGMKLLQGALEAGAVKPQYAKHIEAMQELGPELKKLERGSPEYKKALMDYKKHETQVMMGGKVKHDIYNK